MIPRTTELRGGTPPDPPDQSAGTSMGASSRTLPSAAPAMTDWQTDSERGGGG